MNSINMGLGDMAAGRTVPCAASSAAERAFDSEEDGIELNGNELNNLQETLAGYPLDLRIACEEIIAEQDVRRELLEKLIRNLVRGSPARKTAALAGEILEKPINVPRCFKKSSVEAMEAEAWKSGFTCIFFRKLFPVLRLVTLLAIAAGSVFYFIFK